MNNIEVWRQMMTKNVFEKKLRKMIVAVSIIAVILFLVSVSLRIYLNNIVEDSMVQQIDDEIDKYIEVIQQQIDNDYQILESFGSIFQMDGIEEDEEFPRLLEMANQQNDFATMMYFDSSRQGIIANLYAKTRVDQPLDDIQKEIQDVVEDAFLGKKVISDIFESRFSHRLVYAYGIPVYKDGKVEGALLSTKRIDLLLDIGKGDNILGGNTYTYLVSGTGDILVDSKKDIFNQSTIFSQPYFDDSDLEKVAHSLASQQDITSSFVYGGEQYQALLKSIGTNNWYLFSVNMLEDSNLFADQNVKIVGMIFVIIMALVIALLVFGYRVTLKTNHELTRFAYYDNLTGAYNFSYFTARGKAMLKNRQACSVAVLNIRQFKFFNEIFGHDQGNRLLIYIKKVIEKNLKEDEFFCRDTADQFYIFFTETKETVLKMRLEQMMDDIDEYCHQLNSNYHLKVQCGVVVSTEKNTSEAYFDSLVVRVMFALAKAKEKVMTNIWFYDDQLHKQEIIDNYIESHMEQALKDHEFKLYLQPKVMMKDGTLHSSEALVRWILQDGKVFYPNQFIPLFEESGFCKKLDMYMFEQACMQIRQWLNDGLTPIGISVNQSKLSFYEVDYVEHLKALVEKYQIPPHFITLEILEDLAADNVDEVNEKIHLLHEIGFRVSMDDFGSGYSSLNILGKLKIDELKLDKGFLQEIFEKNNQKAKIILEERVKLAKNLSIETVVEGVETEEYHDLMKSFGCDYGQGYYYDKPMSQQDFNQRYMKKDWKEE